MGRLPTTHLICVIISCVYVYVAYTKVSLLVSSVDLRRYNVSPLALLCFNLTFKNILNKPKFGTLVSMNLHIVNKTTEVRSPKFRRKCLKYISLNRYCFDVWTPSVDRVLYRSSVISVVCNYFSIKYVPNCQVLCSKWEQTLQRSPQEVFLC